ncbi:hypothetical protein ACHHYP_11430 [Achlya hypogyna]|uniref:Ribosomal RNA methyltransferase FtsJ domain-containing protein n=1 Tax=Achlya hypogyna TaxID=1202772 RepID=A0A1V9YJ74_ACHHY|nr:hypothetical protein ACHHYP_11430 [Achlya hypogyna]
MVCDGAPDVTGVHDIDEFVQLGLFMAKIFQSKDYEFLTAQLSLFIAEVTCAKPQSSRASSNEHFEMCRGL